MRQLDALLGPIDGQHRVAVFSGWFAQHRGVIPTFTQRRPRDVLSYAGVRPAGSVTCEEACRESTGIGARPRA